MAKMNYEQVMEIVNEAKRYVDGWFQFRHCQAYYSETIRLPKGNYVLFRSYQTIVALVDINNGVVYRLGKWSQTTSKQTTQFCNANYSSFEQVQF